MIKATASRSLGQSAHVLHKTLERFRSWRHGLWVKVGSFAYEWLTRSLGGNLYFFYNTEHTKKKTAYAKLLTQQVSSKKLTPAYATQVLAYARPWYETTNTTHMKGGLLQCSHVYTQCVCVCMYLYSCVVVFPVTCSFAFIKTLESTCLTPNPVSFVVFVSTSFPTSDLIILRGKFLKPKVLGVTTTTHLTSMFQVFFLEVNNPLVFCWSNPPTRSRSTRIRLFELIDLLLKHGKIEVTGWRAMISKDI